ncbi:uncharacterized protein LOC100897642 [Galendromus occidentalis]|uniref:Uncharacterized protein LOC100897642 n=1 Tax=Galendromus occidentalis TaxID=34638 RepID=A0AAJ6QWT2_9ACAR|nr:uncharacterized protein LOC100897642 [Galendromus occidentalis]
MISWYIPFSALVLFCASSETSGSRIPRPFLESVPSNRILHRSSRSENYTCRDGYSDLHQTPTMAFSASIDARRTSEPVGGFRQLQCLNCREFGAPESATCTNDRYGEAEVSYPQWTCKAEFRMRNIQIYLFDMDCTVDRASFFQNCVKKDSCILRITAAPGYMLGHILAVTVLLAVLGILIYFGIRYFIDDIKRRRYEKNAQPGCASLFRKSFSKVEADLDPSNRTASVGDREASSPVDGVLPFRDDPVDSTDSRKSAGEISRSELENPRSIPLSPGVRFSIRGAQHGKSRE